MRCNPTLTTCIITTLLVPPIIYSSEIGLDQNSAISDQYNSVKGPAMPPRVVVEPLDIETGFFVGGQEDCDVNILNEGNAEIDWRIEIEIIEEPDRDRHQRPLRRDHNQAGPGRDDPGDIIARYEVPSDDNSALAWDGELMWATDRNDMTLFALNPDDGEIVHNFDIHRRPRALMFDGENLWCSSFDNGNHIWLYDRNGDVVNQFDLETNDISGLAYDRDLFVYVADWSDQRIYVVSFDNHNIVAELNVLEAMDLVGHQVSRIEWVPSHRDGHLWVHVGTWNGERAFFAAQLTVDEDWNVEQVQRFRWEQVGHVGIAHDGENLWRAGYDERFLYVHDDGIVEMRWIDADPTEGTLNPDEDTDFNINLKGLDLIGGDYEAVVHVLSNDDDNPDVEVSVMLHLVDAPDIYLAWEIGLEDHLIDWNEYFSEIFPDFDYTVPVTVWNRGTELLEIEEIESDNGAFRAALQDFELEPGAQQIVEFIFAPEAVAEYTAEMVIRCNDPDEEEATLELQGEAFNPPEIVVDPREIEDELLTGERSERSFNIANNGEVMLRWSTSIEIVAEPERDYGQRRLRNIHSSKPRQGTDENIPLRDNPGDVLYEVESPLGANQYRNIGYDADNNWMWHQQYMAPKRMIAWDLNGFDPENNDAPEIAAEWNSQATNPMDFAICDGIIYVMELWGAHVGLYDRDGERIGNLNLDLNGGRANGVAIDIDEAWLFVGSDAGQQDLYVFDLQGEQIANLGSFRRFIGNEWWRAIEWVSQHPDGQLWVNSERRVWQIGVNTDEWNYIGDEPVISFETHSTQPYDGIAHDGHDLWVCSYQVPIINVYDDGMQERDWINIDPVSGEIASDDDEEVFVLLDATRCNGGDYEAVIHVLSNDPDDPDVEVVVSLVVVGAPDITLYWEIETEDNRINWNEYFDDVYSNGEYSVPVRVRNIGTDRLVMEDISSEEEAFIAEPTEFELIPGERRMVEFIFAPEEPGRYVSEMIITSNDPDEGELTVELVAYAFVPPEIVVDPMTIEDMLRTGERAEHSFNIANTGEADLRWELEFAILDEPDRDRGAHGLRGTPPFNSPPGSRGGSSSNITPPGNRGGSSSNITPLALRGGSKGGAHQLHSLNNITQSKGGARQLHSLNDITQSKEGAHQLHSLNDITQSKEGAHQLNDSVEITEREVRAPHRDDPGDIVSEYEVPFNRTRGIAWDGELMWGIGYSARQLIALDPENGEIVHSYDIHRRPTSITFDGENLWIGEDFTARIRIYDREGNQLDDFNLIAFDGIAYVGGGLMLLNSPINRLMHVFDLRNLEEVASFEFIHLCDNQDVDCIEWVPTHRRGQLWCLAGERVYQLRVHDDWEVDLAQDFAWNADGESVGIAHDGENIWHGMQDSQLWFVHDDGVFETDWISVDPVAGELGEDEEEDVFVILDATGLFGGDYEAGIYIHSNDLDNPDIEVAVNLEVEGAPDIEPEWEIGLEDNIINWNEYFDEVYVNGEYEIPVTIRNIGTDDLTVENIECEDEIFTARPTDFELPPQEQRTVEFIFTPDEANEYISEMVIRSNDPDEEEITIDLRARAFDPPEIIIEPLEIQERLFTGEQAEHSFNITNEGEAELRWSTEIEIISEPDQDGNARILRSAPPFDSPPGNRGGSYRNISPPALQGGSYRNIPPPALRGGSYRNITPPTLRGGSKGEARQLPNPDDKIIAEGGAPRRDDPGDVLQQFEVPFQNTSGMAWDGELMWGCSYGSDRLIALDPVEGEVVINEDIHNNPLAMTFDGELLWIGEWNDNRVAQYDLEGNQVGEVQLGFAEIAGLAADGDGHILMNSGDDGRIHVINIDDGGQEADFEYRNAMGNANIYNICWVPEHPEGQLWGLADGRVYQVFVDDDWNVEAVQDFAWNGDQQYCGMAHDGENLWHGMWGQTLWFICEDGVDELNWISVEPETGELAENNSVEVNVTLDAAGLIGGDYEADIHVLSNDPDDGDVEVNVALEVVGAPDIEVDWEIGADDNLIDWNRYFDEVYNNGEYVVEVTIMNDGTDILEIEDIRSDGELFTAAPREFDLRVHQDQVVEFTFAPEETDEYQAVMVIISNDPDEEEIEIQLRAESFEPPEVIIDPLEIEDFLLTGEHVEHSFNISNNGEAVLRWIAEIQIIDEPDRDERSLRSAPPFDSPPGNRGGSSSNITSPGNRGGGQ